VEASEVAGAQRPLKLLDDDAVKSFIMKGWMKISPEEVGLPRAFMQTIYDKMSALHDDTHKKIGENSHSAVPEIHDVMAQPAVAGALQSLLGKDYSLHPHTFTHIKDDIGADQDWHKDGFLPRNGHGIRYHQPEHVLVMFYPQDTVEELGATEILPCTQYWMNDNAPEENFPTSGRTVGQGLSRIEDLDERAAARAATLAELGWPHETAPTRLVVPAGSIGITHFDVYHRGTHRSVGPDHDKRIMIKLWYFRTRDNAEPSWNHVPADDDHAPVAFRTDAGVQGAQEPIWCRMWHWMLGNGTFKGDAPIRPIDEVGGELSSLTQQLRASASGTDAAKIEPSRVGAAYRLAIAGEQGVTALEEAFLHGSPLYPESLARDPTTYNDYDPANSLKVDGVERSASYGLAALPGYLGVPVLTRVAADRLTTRNKRALALHALGQCAPADDSAVLELLASAVKVCGATSLSQQPQDNFVAGSHCPSDVAVLVGSCLGLCAEHGRCRARILRTPRCC
jgi:hypothetical protein